MRKRPVLVETSGGLPVAPLIDVVLLLLIFFMLVSRYLPPSLSVTLPEASESQVIDLPSVAIAIDVEGRLSFNGEITDWPSLPRLLSSSDPKTQVRISADRGVDYDYVVRALDACAQAGLNQIALETKAPR